MTSARCSCFVFGMLLFLLLLAPKVACSAMWATAHSQQSSPVLCSRGHGTGKVRVALERGLRGLGFWVRRRSVSASAAPSLARKIDPRGVARNVCSSLPLGCGNGHGRAAGKALANGQPSGAGWQITLEETVGLRVHAAAEATPHKDAKAVGSTRRSLSTGSRAGGRSGRAMRGVSHGSHTRGRGWRSWKRERMWKGVEARKHGAGGGAEAQCTVRPRQGHGRGARAGLGRGRVVLMLSGALKRREAKGMRHVCSCHSSKCEWWHGIRP